MSRDQSFDRRVFLRSLGAGAVGVVAVGALASCGPDDGTAASPGATSTTPTTPPAALAQVSPAVAGGATEAVSPRPRIDVVVTGGTLTAVDVHPYVAAPATGSSSTGSSSTGSSGSGASGSSASSSSTSSGASATSSTSDPAAAGAPGTLDEKGWTAADPLELGATYEAVATATNADGATSTGSVVFSVIGEDASATAKMMPLDSETVGVGMPVVVILSRAVPEDRRQALTDAITIDRPAEVEGAWRWISDDTVHWRTKDYWPAGTQVRVQVPLTQVDLGDGAWGQADRDISFTVGDAHVSVADTDTHQMTTSINGAVARTIPISAGREDSDPHFVTRSGVHLVSEKYADYLMDGATVGLDYETQVKWATRIANSGEFVHGAPWSVPSQGVRNVSHGCLNASDENARWFYELAQRGDVVEVTGTDRPLELTNGLGDWTLSWEQWQA